MPDQAFSFATLQAAQAAGDRKALADRDRPLLHLHLQRLEAAGLIVGTLELSEDGKAMRYYEVTDFDLHLTAAALAEAAKTLTRSDPEKGPAPKEDS